MKRSRQLLLLGVAIILFAAMVVLVWSGIAQSRNRRDMVFGLERFAMLIEANRLDEATAMVPWLAERVADARDGAELLRLTFDLTDAGAQLSVLADAAAEMVDHFPDNANFRRIAVFTLARAGRAEQALSLAREVPPSITGEAYAYALLSLEELEAVAELFDHSDNVPTGLLLARLPAQGSKDDYLEAYRITSDPRYAQNAVLRDIESGNLDNALETALSTGIAPSAPLLASELALDRGEYDRVLSLLSSASGDPRAQALRADTLMLSGDTDGALVHYRALRDAPAYADLAALNLMTLNESSDPASELPRLMDEFPDSWAIARAMLLLGWVPEQHGLERWSDSEFRNEYETLRLIGAADPDRRGHAAEIWRSVNRRKGRSISHYAAWYFHARRELNDLETLIRQVARELQPEPVWLASYRGLLMAESDRWPEAVSEFESAYRRLPSWYNAHNWAIALHRTAEAPRGREALTIAVGLAEATPDVRAAETLLMAAEQASDVAEKRRLASLVLERDPANASAALILSQLENGRGR